MAHTHPQTNTFIKPSVKGYEFQLSLNQITQHNDKSSVSLLLYGLNQNVLTRTLNKLTHDVWLTLPGLM